MKLMRWAYFEVSQLEDPSMDLDPPLCGLAAGVGRVPTPLSSFTQLISRT